MSDSDKLLKDFYRRAMAVCHPDRAPAHLHSFLEAKAKELNAAYTAGSFAQVRKIAEELGVKDISPSPKSESAPQKPKSEPQQQPRREQAEPRTKDSGIDFQIWVGWGFVFLIALLLLIVGNQTDAGNQTTYEWTLIDSVGSDLHSAAYNGNADVVNVLLSEGISPHQENKYGETALHWAAYNGHAAVVKILLSVGANPNQTRDTGETALDYAKEKRHSEIVRMLEEAGAR